MAAAPPADLGAALLNADRIRRTTEFLPFFGRPEKDTISARLLIDRINNAAVIAGWNDQRKAAELYMVLRDKAMLWYDSLASKDVATNNWDQLKTAFLATYEPRYTAKTTCANFTDLSQKMNETVNDFYSRVNAAIRVITEHQPDAMNAIRAAHDGVADNVVNPIKAEGISDTYRYFQRCLFTAGLRDDLRMKIMEGNHETLAECYTAAIELETLINEKRRVSHVTAIEEEEDSMDNDMEALKEWPQDEVDKMNDGKIAAINKIRGRFNKRPIYKRFNGNNGNRGGPKRGNCRYCNKYGHFQRECKARKAANGAMVGADGKPFANKVNAVQENEEPRVSTIQGSTTEQVARLNW